MKSILTILLTAFGIMVVAQHSDKVQTPDNHPYLIKVAPSPILKSKPLSFVSTPIQADVAFSPILISPRSPNDSHDESEYENIRAEQQKLRDDPNNSKVGNDSEGVSGVSFDIGEGFFANLDNGCPNDNTIAVSDGGKIISMMNGHVGIYTTNGVQLNTYSLEAFFNFLVDDPCDPKVEYDARSDRFFMFVQACDSDKENVAMAFSQTNDPNGNWNTYIFDSDALGDGSWSDYPKIAITRDEIFVSMNLFQNGGNGSFRQSIVYQLDKYDGYQGNSLSHKIWEDFPSTTLIIRSGVGQYGPGAYLINAPSNSGSKITLTDITGNLEDSGSQKKTYEIPVDPYDRPPPAYQPNTDYRLDTGDCRPQDGYYQNGIIHFVHMVSNEAYASIRYHRLDPDLLNGNNYFLTTAVGEKDYSYPSIAPFTTDINDQTSIVHFAASGSDTSPEMRAKVFNHDFTTENSGYIYSSNGAVKSDCYNADKDYCRWGDYSGIAVKYNESTPTVWVAGSVVSQGVNSWWTYIAELTAVGNSTSTNQIHIAEMKAFPNPAVNYISVQIESNKKIPAHFSIINAKGKLISKLYSGALNQGENRFTFDTSSLQPGTYFLIISKDSNEIIKTEKIIIHK